MAENQTKNREIGAGEPLIQVKELCKSFDGVDVLKNITTTIKKGEVVFVVGPSGSGKSTFLRCMNLLEDIGFFSSEIGPSALFQAYKLIKNGEKQGKSREDICSALREKFGEKNPEMQVLN